MKSLHRICKLLTVKWLNRAGLSLKWISPILMTFHRTGFSNPLRKLLNDCYGRVIFSLDLVCEQPVRNAYNFDIQFTYFAYLN